MGMRIGPPDLTSKGWVRRLWVSLFVIIAVIVVVSFMSAPSRLRERGESFTYVAGLLGAIFVSTVVLAVCVRRYVRRIHDTNR
jgi:uncharacterized membrane protein